ncbi:MAG: RES family NAD+ phosphorylase [Caulobacteraceae bacterium]
MIPTISLQGRYWRVLSPKWAHDPLSGSGAARNGGRWNRRGVPALYMSEHLETAIAEYQQELGVRPGTFVAYEVTCGQIIDLTDPAIMEELELSPGDMVQPWRRRLLIDGKPPRTWALADDLSMIAQGALVPSAIQPGARNLVLWNWTGLSGAAVTPLDPNLEIPLAPRQ